MVIRILVLPLLLSLSLSATAERTEYNADSLRKRLENKQDEKIRAGDRLKASRNSLKSLSILQGNDIHYKFPNGAYVPGLLLPNGKVSPAIKTRAGIKPACITVEFKLVPGEYDEIKEIVQCELAASELAVITNKAVIQQTGIESNKTQETLKKHAHGESSSNNISKEERITPSAKYGNSQIAIGNAPSLPTNSKVKAQTSQNFYRPPSRNSTSSNSIAGVMQKDKNKFGVPIGTWIEAKLLRSVSSAETGYIEYMTISDVEGRYQVFPLGTVLFADKFINEAERRLESLTVIARLPNGDEIPGVRFRVYSLDKTAGLSGQLVRDRQSELEAAGKNASLDAISNAAISNNNAVISTAVNSIKNSLTSTEQRYTQGAKKAIIKVPPQKVLLKLTQTF